MCTVSYIHTDKGVAITSNRDEHLSRPSSLKPEKSLLVNGQQLLYPKDPKAGGTWFVVRDDNTVVVLLNGAFENHVSTGNYARSRGLILLEVISSAKSPYETLTTIDLTNIEPFTLVVCGEDLMEFRWDGDKKYFKPLDAAHNYIWSSATLYDGGAQKMRQQLFESFISSSQLKITPTDVIDFHSNDFGDPENGFVINRSSGLKTFSITQVLLKDSGAQMQHRDILNKKEYTSRFGQKQAVEVLR